jgi:hypothetical protein
MSIRKKVDKHEDIYYQGNFINHDLFYKTLTGIMDDIMQHGQYPKNSINPKFTLYKYFKEYDTTTAATLCMQFVIKKNKDTAAAKILHLMDNVHSNIWIRIREDNFVYKAAIKNQNKVNKNAKPR